MKIAVGGKGGTGKTTLTALLALSFLNDGDRVIAIDADPDANLASTLGYPHPEDIVPIVEMKSLIEERTGAKPGGFGGYFKLNPRVDDIPDRFVVDYNGMKLLVMGRVREPAGGCMCPENVFLKELTTHLVLYRDEIMIMDMEAGIEHLGRGTAKNMDAFLVVVEPSGQSLESGKRIIELAEKLGIPDIYTVLNKVASQEDIDYIKRTLPDIPIAGIIPFSTAVREASRGELPIESVGKELTEAIQEIKNKLAP